MSFLLTTIWRRAWGSFSGVHGGIKAKTCFDDFQLVHEGPECFVAILIPKELRISGNVPNYITVLDIGDQVRVTGEWVAEQLRAFEGCDTFKPNFLRGILFTGSSADHVVLETEVQAILKDSGVEWTGMHSPLGEHWHLRSGPHLVDDGKVFELRRLYNDTYECFVCAIAQTNPSNPFKPLKFTADEDTHCLSVAVPSRLQTNSCSDSNNLGKPLAGLRVAVKDNFHTAGIKTSLCNRAYLSLYPPAKTTATCIQKLIDAGAIIVGKTKLVSFAATEEPLECVDIPAPWNPRADGYQSPAGSSSGSGAAVAAYDWLDIAVGSDTSGSGRRPGHWNGCIAMRPSHGKLPVEGLVSSFMRFDVPTFFGRDLRKCRDFAGAWYGEALSKPQGELPVSIVVLNDYLDTINNEAQLNLIELFVSDMEDFFKVKRRTLALEPCWDESAPKEADGLGLLEFMKDACKNSFWYDDFHHMDSFREGYKRKYGKMPYVSPPVRWQWSIASEITKTQRDDAVKRLDVYQKWFAGEVMKVGKLNTIVVLPVENISPRYRDRAPSRTFEPTGVPMLFLSPILRAPELTIPIGQVLYHSEVTDCDEFLPVGLSLMASPDCDLELMDSMLKCLKHANRPTVVRTGRRVFL